MRTLARSVALASSLAACDGGGSTGFDGDALPPKDAAPAADATPDAAPTPEATIVALAPGVGFLGVWGRADDDVYLAGVGLRQGFAGVVAHWDGHALSWLDVPAGPPLWWIHAAPGLPARAAGEGGRVLVERGGAFVDEPTGLEPEAHLWGTFATSATDCWVVGGYPSRGADRGIILRSACDGAWAPVTAEPLPELVYKVWGPTADDVWFVGEGGFIAHWDGMTLTPANAGNPAPLFTVHGVPGAPAQMVGGAAAGELVLVTATSLLRLDLPDLPPLSGVFALSAEDSFLVGAHGTVLRGSVSGEPRLQRLAGADPRPLHAVWAGAAAWAVGPPDAEDVAGLLWTTAPVPAFETPPSVRLMPDAGALTDAAVTPPDAQGADAAAQPDDGLPDRGPPDDAGPPSDARPPDPDAGTRVDAGHLRDAGPLDPDDGVVADATPPADARLPDPDAALELDAAPPPPDAAPPEPDLGPPDMRLPDAMPPDLGPPLPGPGEDCPQFLCQAPAECLRISRAENRPVCVVPCLAAQECGPAFGAAPCCQRPGPQVLRNYCLPTADCPPVMP